MSTNDITGDALRTKPVSEQYAEGWDRIFGKKMPVDRGNVPDEQAVCIYPDCNCPFDAPPGWCARGLPHINKDQSK